MISVSVGRWGTSCAFGYLAAFFGLGGLSRGAQASVFVLHLGTAQAPLLCSRMMLKGVSAAHVLRLASRKMGIGFCSEPLSKDAEIEQPVGARNWRPLQGKS
jgi:hypothetical protein